MLSCIRWRWFKHCHVWYLYAQIVIFEQRNELFTVRLLLEINFFSVFTNVLKVMFVIYYQLLFLSLVMKTGVCLSKHSYDMYVLIICTFTFKSYRIHLYFLPKYCNHLRQHVKPCLTIDFNLLFPRGWLVTSKW